MLLNFGDLTRTGVFSIVWSLPIWIIHFFYPYHSLCTPPIQHFTRSTEGFNIQLISRVLASLEWLKAERINIEPISRYEQEVRVAEVDDWEDNFSKYV